MTEKRWYPTRIEYELQMSLPVLPEGSRAGKKLDRRIVKLRREICMLSVPRVPKWLWDEFEVMRGESKAYAALFCLGEFVEKMDFEDWLEAERVRREEAQKLYISPTELVGYLEALGRYELLLLERWFSEVSMGAR